MKRNDLIKLGLLLLTVCLVYANHFNNSFHFDDSHTVVQNPVIRSLANWPRILTDGTAFSVLPANQGWRPLLTLSLTFDYWLGGGLHPWAFHLDSFVMFLLLIVCVYQLYRRVVPGWELAGTALYALHPVCAETVNYIIQRGDLMATLGCAAGIVLYGRGSRWFLLCFLFAGMSKPNGVVFPLLLAAWMLWVERRWRWRPWLLSCVLAGVLVLLCSFLTPASYVPGAHSRWAYWWTQPYVICTYVKTLFWPNDLVADTDLSAFSSPWQWQVVLGLLGLGLLIALMLWCARRPTTQPVAFGLAWFFSALVLTSIVPLAEVTNDHRMFFAYVGLVLALMGGLSLLNRPWTKPALAVAVLACTWGTVQRNRVWRSEKTLWRDNTLKAPLNGRAWMNYGLSLMSEGHYPEAAQCYQKAAQLAPTYSLVFVNLGILEAAQGHDGQARQAFARARQLAPTSPEPDFFEARWLQAREPMRALGLLEQALTHNSQDEEARQLLLSLATQQKDWKRINRWRRLYSKQEWQLVVAAQNQELEQAKSLPTSEKRFIELSFVFSKQGRAAEAEATAEEGLRHYPASPNLQNNLAAAAMDLGHWDQAVRAASRALALRPGWELARNNLEYAREQSKMVR